MIFCKTCKWKHGCYSLYWYCAWVNCKGEVLVRANGNANCWWGNIIVWIMSEKFCEIGFRFLWWMGRTWSISDNAEGSCGFNWLIQWLDDIIVSWQIFLRIHHWNLLQGTVRCILGVMCVIRKVSLGVLALYVLSLLLLGNVKKY